MIDYEKVYAELMGRIKKNLPELKVLLEDVSGHWHYEDLVYRFYHQSYKVQWIKDDTKKIYEALKELKDPDRDLDSQYEQIVKEGTTTVPDLNESWSETRKWVEAFFHSKYFLEMVVKYGEEYDKVPNPISSGFAAVLELYSIR